MHVKWNLKERKSRRKKKNPLDLDRHLSTELIDVADYLSFLHNLPLQDEREILV